MFRACKLFTLSIYLFLCAFSLPILSIESIPSIDVQTKFQNGNAGLAGEWGLVWGEWPELSDIYTSNIKFKPVQLPNFISSLVDEERLNERRYGTYLLHIDNLNQVFKEPAIHMSPINDAWQAWWIDELGQTQFLGESGKISQTLDAQKMRFKTHILLLPKHAQSGTLVIYLSDHVYKRAGIYGELEIQELQSVNKGIHTDLASRVALISIGLLVVFQNLIFYLLRPKEKVLLLLAVLAFAVLFRAAISTDYVYYFLGNPDNFNWIIKLEYITIVWPPLASVHFFAHLFPTRHCSFVIKVGYIILAACIAITILLPIVQVINSLIYYQLVLVIFSLYALWLILRSMFIKSLRSLLVIISAFVLFLGVVNDIYAAQSSWYNFYIAEYTMFVFLFVQTQYHSLRFVAALDIAEHLTDNLQKEVADKTQELSIRNQELEEKAENLKIQHDKIKILSETDHLTGLYNRQTFDDKLEARFAHACKNSEHLTLIILDLDNFKSINDNYGHLVGDECLKMAAKYLSQINLGAEDFVARYGGEEIVIILANTDIESARDLSQKICEGFRKLKLETDFGDIKITASFGLAERIYNKIENVEHLIKWADDALYQAKATGKNKVAVANA
ncbi:diguanylate cyclase [Paraglaciecola sp. L3A3]|uniref:sensor domain-containing diguanylate cyclase n=1 Tax=Paraglaciecola sp. L3A3 TaxID=2686358 RepID=UPI00131AF099|nr:diguanylate cyclase [Paraglaciecola sp. L3A3]